MVHFTDFLFASDLLVEITAWHNPILDTGNFLYCALFFFSSGYILSIHVII